MEPHRGWATARAMLTVALAHPPQGPYGTTLPNAELWDAHIRPPGLAG